MMFQLRKLYADLVAADGTVTVVYLTWTNACGIRLASAGVEQYGPDGGREVRHARPVDWTFDPDSVAGCWSVRLELSQDVLELRYQGSLPPWRPPEPGPHRDMEWRVLVPRAAVEGSWNGPTTRHRLEGQGYIDWVELRRAPRFLGMRELHWGRVHLPNETLVFTALGFRTGRSWKRAARWGTDGVQELDTELRCGPDGGLRLHTALGPDLSLSPVRVLHEGPGLDAARFPATPARLLARAVTGSLHERRWLAHAGRSPSVNTGWALHEVVNFGTGNDAHRRPR